MKLKGSDRKPKILALDLDGTTVDDTGVLHDRTKDALRRARKAGAIVCFVTGRRDVDMYAIKDQCPGLADYLILNNGGKLVRVSGGEVLFNEYMRERDAREIIEYCLEHGYQLHLVSGMYWAVNRWTEGLQAYVDMLGTQPILYGSPDEVPYTKMEGMMATADADKVAKYLDKAGLEIYYVYSEPGCIDIMPKGIHKWNGVRRFLDMFGYTAEQVIAAGDFDSDVSMLQGAGIGVAVQNAQPCAKAAADYITNSDNNHDAVADIIDDLLLGLRKGLCIPVERK